MTNRSYLLILLLATTAPAVRGAEAWIAVVVATEQGVQATAHRQWLQLLTDAGADDVRLRGQQRGDKPSLQATGTPDRPRYSLVGMLDSRGILTLPAGRFDSRSVGKLRDYFDRLSADGAEGVTAERGAFGLTKKQTALIHDDLSQAMPAATAGVALADVLKAVNEATRLEIRVDNPAWQIVRKADAVAEEVEPLTIGTALAILLKRHALALVPTKERGAQVVHRIARASDIDGETWPVGWKPDRPPSQLAPALTEQLNAAVEGFTLSEAMKSIEPRMDLPVFWDFAMMREHQIDPANVDVKLARQQTRLGRVVDRLLFQARLRGELKVDEAGTPFYWISR